MKTGIYFLLRCGEVVYIGKTKRYPDRLWHHKSQKMDYDSVRFIECDEENLSRYEKRWIERFIPKHNKSLKPTRFETPVPMQDRKKTKIYRHMKFRRLTEKSIIGFGNHKESTVAVMIARGKGIELINMYYNLSHITFFDDILDQLKITDEWRIAKPGVDKNKGCEFKHTVYADLMSDRSELSDKRRAKKSLESIKYLDSISNDKQWLKSRNQR